ncbi:MAG TPA: twin-arginine translocase TatA/TatE family subunit [Gaiellaceae bacterium]|nr:twin-arginine translocase TatA/TatE family subunit [Gaiellaceae bacterium]
MPGFIGMPELLLLALVALVLFGPKRLPEMGRGLGKGLREFKESVTGDHKEEHSFTGSHLVVPDELTAAPIIPETTTTSPVAAPVLVVTEKVV